MIKRVREFEVYENFGPTLKLGEEYVSEQLLRVCVGSVVQVGFETKENREVYIRGILQGPPYVLVRTNILGRPADPIPVDPKKITGLLFKIDPNVTLK